MANYVDVVNTQRERDRLTNQIDGARFSDKTEANLNAAGATNQDKSGYYDGAEYKPFFRLGISQFGDSSVLS